MGDVDNGSVALFDTDWTLRTLLLPVTLLQLLLALSLRVESKLVLLLLLVAFEDFLSEFEFWKSFPFYKYEQK